jgi:hypothetical protein
MRVSNANRCPAARAAMAASRSRRVRGSAQSSRKTGARAIRSSPASVFNGTIDPWLLPSRP